MNFEVHTLNALAGKTTWASSQIDKTTVAQAVTELSASKTFVAAAGNTYPKGSTSKSLPILKNTILVGSATEAGLASAFSDQSPDVTIFAPSDHYLASPTGGKDKRFGGTSGATPMVTGALANVRSLIEGFTTNEAKLLLQKTATPLPGRDVFGPNAPGLLNAYKLVRVADRLRTKGWPANRAEITSPQLFDFSAEAKTEFAKAKAEKSDGSCDAYNRSVDHLRKAFLLDPTPEHAGALALAISQSSTPRDALLYAIRTPRDLDAYMMADQFEDKETAKQKYSQMKAYPAKADAQTLDRFKNEQRSNVLLYRPPPASRDIFNAFALTPNRLAKLQQKARTMDGTELSITQVLQLQIHNLQMQKESALRNSNYAPPPNMLEVRPLEMGNVSK